MSSVSSIGPLVDRLCARFDDRDEALALLTDLIVFIASADAIIDETERRVLVESLETMLEAHVAPRIVKVVVDESRLRLRTIGPMAAADTIGRTLASRGAAEDGIRLAVYVAAISEGISNVERLWIERMAEAAGVSLGRLHEFMAEPFAC